jgi:hypothetical protein
MSRRGQHGAVAIGILALLLAACGGDSTASGAGNPTIDVAAPEIGVPGLHAVSTTIVLDDVAKEAADPAAIRQVLTGAGFVAGGDRTLTGGRGVFSRVVLREWLFAGEAGATGFRSWITDHGDQLIGETEGLEVPAGIDAGLPTDLDVQVHHPTGCCHEEVPIYLATWRDGTTVWTLRASGARIRTAPVFALLDDITKET